MTHGVEITKWRVKDTQFSLWDFAGKTFYFKFLFLIILNKK